MIAFTLIISVLEDSGVTTYNMSLIVITGVISLCLVVCSAFSIFYNYHLTQARNEYDDGFQTPKIKKNKNLLTGFIVILAALVITCITLLFLGN